MQLPPSSHAAAPGWDGVFVHELLTHSAEVNCNRPALQDQAGRSVSYGELLGRVSELSARLILQGVRPDDRVAVLMGQSMDLVIAMWAVLRAGGAYVPIDRTNPASRVTAMLQSVRPAVVVTDTPRGLASTLEPALPFLEFLGGQDPAPSRRIEARPALRPDHLAYVIHTSGSTGQPKGVAMSHRGLSRLIAWQIGDGPGALKTLQFTSMGFDVTFQEVLSTLATGGTLVTTSDALRRDPEGLLRFLDRHGIERVFLPCVALQQLAKAAERTGIAPQSLRHVLTAGEQLVATDAIARFFASMPQCRLDNHYGPTEAHLVTRSTLTQDALQWPALPAIGRAVGDVTVSILDADMNPVASGAIGEVFVGGGCLARGYLGAPALTAERFLPNPHGPGRIYKTGDLALLGSDGELRFMGRVDEQLKVRGHRVEPGEVEARLSTHPAVRDAVVGLRALSDGVDVLVAYVVSDNPPSVTELARHVAASLPAYMVPSRFLFVDRLPLTASGKVDRTKLLEIEMPSAPTQVAQGGSMEDRVRSIWERVLGHDEFGLDDDFFEIGGDSLLATWVVAELRQLAKRQVELSTMLRESSVRGLVRALESQVSSAQDHVRESELVTLRAGPSKRVLYLFHPLGGELLAYRALAQAMRIPMRILGVQWRPELHGGAERTLEAIASAHVEQLLTVQPDGPYCLGGWSFGGVMAYEVARQLVAAGRVVEFLGLIDANPVRDPLTGHRTAQTEHLAALTRLVDELDADQGAAHSLTGDVAVRRLLGAVAEALPVEHLRYHLQAARLSMQAAMRYRALPCRAAIYVLQAIDGPSRELLADELRALADGPLQIHVVPGDHLSMLRTPQVDETARLLDQLLSRERVV